MSFVKWGSVAEKQRVPHHVVEIWGWDTHFSFPFQNPAFVLQTQLVQKWIPHGHSHDSMVPSLHIYIEWLKFQGPHLTMIQMVGPIHHHHCFY